MEISAPGTATRYDQTNKKPTQRAGGTDCHGLIMGRDDAWVFVYVARLYAGACEVAMQALIRAERLPNTGGFEVVSTG